MSQALDIRPPAGNDSEVGQLRRAIVHRPGLELTRLTRSNSKALLFDDALWAARALDEHNSFTQVLLEHGVAVLQFEVLLAEALEAEEARTFALDRLCTAEAVGPGLVSPLREYAGGLDAAALAELLIAGVRRADLTPVPSGSLRWESLQQSDFVVGPLPNTLFQRDSSTWIYGGVTINPMFSRVRQRESLNSLIVHRFHPEFTRAAVPIIFGDPDAGHPWPTLEGGDIHVLGRGAVLAGIGERSTPMAVERLARELFRRGLASVVIAVQPPKSHRAQHLDTLLTMIDLDSFVFYPGLDPAALSTWIITPARSGQIQRGGTAPLQVEPRDDMFAAIAEVLGSDKVNVLTVDTEARPGRREQLDDANNYLALGPGVVVGYERNTMTNRMLRDHGFTVISISGSELGHGYGRSGARSMTCPIQRDGI